MQDDNKLEEFRKSLEKANYAVPDSATFAETLGDPVKAKAFHGALIKDNYNVPEDFEIFSSSLGLKKKDSPADFGLPSEEALSEIFSSYSKSIPEVSKMPDEYKQAEAPEEEAPIETGEFKTPDLSLQTPKFGNFTKGLFDNIVADATKRGIDSEKFKQHAEKRIKSIDEELTGLEEYAPQVTPGAPAYAIYSTDTVSEGAKKRETLLQEKDELEAAIKDPSKADYFFGKIVSGTIAGLASQIYAGGITGGKMPKELSQEWLAKYDANTMTNVAATAIGFLLDNPVFAGLGTIGATAGKKAIQPLVRNLMNKSVDKFVKFGFEKPIAEKLALKGISKLATSIPSIASSGTALGGYGMLQSGLTQLADPEKDFKDIDFGQVLSRGMKDFVLGMGVSTLGLGTAALARQAQTIPQAGLRVGTQAGIQTGGLTAESALFVGGGALLDGRALKDITKEEFLETVALLGTLKLSHGIQEPLQTAKNIYRSTKFDPQKPGQGQYAVDIAPWEIETLGAKDYKSLIKDFADNPERLAEIIKNDYVPALMKQKLLWGSQGVAMENVNLYADNIKPDGEFVDIYNKEGVLVDKRKFSDKDLANQATVEMGMQLEDNKMQMQSASPEVDRIKLLTNYKNKGGDVTKLLPALDKPVSERTPEEAKMVGDWFSMIPKPKEEKKAEKEKPGEQGKEPEKPEAKDIKAEKKAIEDWLNNEGEEYISVDWNGEFVEIFKSRDKKPEEYTREELIEKGVEFPTKETKPVKEPLSIEGKSFASEEELFKYLDENAIDKETKGIKEGWMSTKELPNEATMKAVNKWEEAKGIVRKPQSVMKEETPEQKSDRILNRLADLQKQYNETPGNFKSRRREMLNIMQRLMGEAPDAKYTLKQEGKNIKILKNGKGLKRTAWKQENRKLADIEEGEFKDFVNTMLGARRYLVDLDAPIGPKLMDKAIEDLLAGKANQNSEYLMKALEESFRSGQLLYKGENKPPRPITVKEVMSEMANEKLTKFVEEQGELSIDNIDKAVEYGLIDKKDVETVKKTLQDENTERARLESEWADEETQALAGIDKERTEVVKDQGKVEGAGEVEPKKEADEAQIKEQSNRPDIDSGKEGGDNVPKGTGEGEKPVAPEGKEKPAKQHTPEQQRQIDAINKEYDEKIVDAQKELEGMTEEARQKVIDKATKEIDKRNTLFGDANASESDLIKPEEQGFEVSRKPIEEAVRKFDERKKELENIINPLNKERKSKIGEVEKQQAMVFEEKEQWMTALTDSERKALSKGYPVNQQSVIENALQQKTVNGKKKPSKIARAIQESRISYEDAEIIIKSAGFKPTEEIMKLRSSETKEKEEGIKFKDKNYTDIDQVLEAVDKGEITFEESKQLREDVNAWEKENQPESFSKSKTAKQNKKYKNEPKTDKPEELAWDEPLPLSPAEDPNFKNSDLNNAMSIRNMARSFIKNMGMKEGADVRVGFITRFARKARGLFNPDSGIIRVRNIRDLRALTHEIGHWLDYEVFDIRGIISAKRADKQLGIGVDFNGNTYSNVAQVEKAMKNGIVTIDEGNYLLDKVKTFEKAKLGEKYSEIVEQSAIVPVKYKNKTYRTAKEITDALSKGVMKNTKASDLIVKLNNNNKGRDQRIQKLRDKYGSDVVDGVLQRNELKKEFDALLRDVGYPSNKRTEGIAEFVYNYVIDPKQLINSTPNALAWFEKMLDNAPEVKNALHKLREQFAEYDAQDIRIKVVAETKTPEKEKTPWLDGIVKIKDNLLYNWVNQLQHMRNLSDEWKKIVGNNAYAYKDPFISAKEIIGIDGRAQQWLLFHPYSRKGNEVIINEDIKGLMQIVKPLIGTADYEPYKAYLIALDSRESHNRNKPEQAYLSRDVADAAIKAFEKQYGVQKLWDFQKSIQTYNEALLDFSAESGRISKETAEYWKNEHQYYVPLRRIAETYEMMGGKRRTITRDMLPESERAIFARKGSAKQIKDIFESMIDNTYRILASSERNLLNRNIADAFKDIHDYNRKNNIRGAVIEEIDARGMEAYQDPTTGEIRYAVAKVRPSNFRPPKGRILTVFEEGKPRFYDVAPEYYDPIFQVTMQMSGMMEKIIKVATAPSRWLQAGAVIYDPTFPIRNIVRDQQSAWFYSKHGYLPTDFIKGLMSFVKKDQYYQKWLASGGDQSFLVSADMMMSEDYVSHKIGSLTRRKFDAYRRNPLLALQDFSRASEIGTRLGAFRNAYKKTGNVHLAAIESRDISADYGIKGATIRHAVQFYPFLNPRIQHARMTAEAMKNPAAFMAKGLALTIPAVMNWLINNQDEESRKLYQSLPTWRRVGLYNIRIPGTDHFLPLPKGFFGTLFASSVESVLDATLKEDARVLDELPKQLFQEISPMGNMTEMVPFPIRPLVEMWANKKGYTGKPIVSESMKMLKPSEQYYNSTPEIIKKLGEALNWSPVKIEHYFRSYTGGAGIGAVNILDETLQAIGLVDKKPEDTFTMLSRMPVFKALLTEKPIGLASGYISDFYETLDKIEQVNVTFNNFVKTENYDALDKFMSDPENKRMYSFYEGNSTALNAFRSVLTYARDSMYAVMKDDLLTKGEKQDEVEKINRIIQESAIKFKDAYENKKFFDYGSAMDEIITKMKSEKKDYRKELIQQQNSYNPYWIQLRGQNKEVYDMLREFGGLRDIEQTKSINVNGEKVTLELEDVRRFNEEVVKKYGENVKNMIGTDKATYEGYQKITNPMNPEQTQLQQILDSAWETAMSQTASTFVPQTPNKVK